jgi:hypothetical protein
MLRARPALVVALPLVLCVACEQSPPAVYATAPPPGVYPTAPAPEAPVEQAAESAPPVQPASAEMQGGAQGDSYADNDPSALQDFRPALDPHGTWVDDPTYGTVWVPNANEVGPGFTPYVTAGHWVYDDDYVWASDYSWGWAPYHYGRWVWLDGPGWVWIAGRRYSGAWVTWRTGDPGFGYVGWAPMPPAWGWRGGVAVGLGSVPEPRYAFVASSDVFAPVVAQRVVAGDRAAAFAQRTRPYVQSAPPAAGRIVAQPTVHGPALAALGIPAASVAHASGNDPGLARAQQFARPSVAARPGAASVQPTTPPNARVAPTMERPSQAGTTRTTGASVTRVPQPNVAPPNVAPPNVAPQNAVPPSVAPPNVAPPNVARPNVQQPNVAPRPAQVQRQPAPPPRLAPAPRAPPPPTRPAPTPRPRGRR